MTDFLVLLVLVIIIGAFIVKYGELFVDLLELIKWLAIPLLIVLAIWLLPKIGSWFMGTL